MASANIEENETNSGCKICQTGPAKYCCPRCNILYCSLNCYRANPHLQCSEYFYKENVLKEISLNVNEETKSKTMGMLQNIHENDKLGNFVNPNIPQEDNVDLEEIENIENLDSDDENYIDIAERLQGVNLDDSDEVWDRLTEDEKQEFIAFLKSEDVTKLIPSWEPWWFFYNENLVEDLNNGESFKTNCPSICEIKNMSQITAKTPSDCVKYNLFNILAAYTFTVRYFNGEHFDFAIEAVSCITSLSLTLKSSENFQDFDFALKSIEQECINSNWISTDADNFKTMKDDLYKILRGPTKFEKKFYILCALSDFRKLLTEALKSLKEDKGSNTSKKFPNEHLPAVKMETSADIKKYRKKIEYYLSFVKDCYDDQIL